MNVYTCVALWLKVWTRVLQVDTSATNSTSEGLMWLRLVQSARDKEEQNLEAYVKNGQLFYRSLRRIEKDEELLVWYGKDLTELLLLSPGRAPTRSKGEARPMVLGPGPSSSMKPYRSSSCCSVCSSTHFGCY